LAHGFRVFTLWSLGSVVGGHVVRWDIMAEKAWWLRAAYHMADRKQNELPEGNRYKGYFPIGLLFLLGSISSLSTTSQ
jgi:hypothetical protein